MVSGQWPLVAPGPEAWRGPRPACRVPVPQSHCQGRVWTSPQARVSERPSGRAVAGPAEGRALCETPGPRRLAGSGPGERSPQGALHVAFTPAGARRVVSLRVTAAPHGDKPVSQGVWRWGEDPGLSRWAQRHPKVLTSERGSRRVRTESEDRTGLQAKGRARRGAGKGRTGSPEPPGGATPAGTWGPAPREPRQSSRPRTVR